MRVKQSNDVGPIRASEKNDFLAPHYCEIASTTHDSHRRPVDACLVTRKAIRTKAGVREQREKERQTPPVPYQVQYTRHEPRPKQNRKHKHNNTSKTTSTSTGRINIPEAV